MRRLRRRALAATSYPAGTSKPQKGESKGRPYKAFDGFGSIEALGNKSRDVERTAAIALSKLNELVEKGEIVVPVKAPAAEGAGPPVEAARDGVDMGADVGDTPPLVLGDGGAPSGR